MFEDIRRTHRFCTTEAVIHVIKVVCCSSSKDGKIFVSDSNDKTLRVWDATSFQVIRELIGHSKGVCILLLAIVCRGYFTVLVTFK